MPLMNPRGNGKLILASRLATHQPIACWDLKMTKGRSAQNKTETVEYIVYYLNPSVKITYPSMSNAQVEIPQCA